MVETPCRVWALEGGEWKAKRTLENLSQGLAVARRAARTHAVAVEVRTENGEGQWYTFAETGTQTLGPGVVPDAEPDAFQNRAVGTPARPTASSTGSRSAVTRSVSGPRANARATSNYTVRRPRTSSGVRITSAPGIRAAGSSGIRRAASTSGIRATATPGAPGARARTDDESGNDSTRTPRRSKRHTIEEFRKVPTLRLDGVLVKLLDLSEDGMKIAVPKRRRPQIGEILRFEAVDREARVEIVGRVAWARRGRLGIELVWDAVPTVARTYIRQLIGDAERWNKRR